MGFDTSAFRHMPNDPVIENGSYPFSEWFNSTIRYYMVYELDIGLPGLSVKQELLSGHASSILVVHPKEQWNAVVKR